jgi:hypothetical protein
VVFSEYRAVTTILKKRKENKNNREREQKRGEKTDCLTGILFYDYISPAQKLQLFTNLKEYIK